MKRLITILTVLVVVCVTNLTAYAGVHISDNYRKPGHMLVYPPDFPGQDSSWNKPSTLPVYPPGVPGHDSSRNKPSHLPYNPF